MNYLERFNKFETVEEGYKQLKEAVTLRDQMAGAMFWNLMNEDCCEIARNIAIKGGDIKLISSILGEGTHV